WCGQLCDVRQSLRSPPNCCLAYCTDRRDERQLCGAHSFTDSCECGKSKRQNIIRRRGSATSRRNYRPVQCTTKSLLCCSPPLGRRHRHPFRNPPTNLYRNRRSESRACGEV